MIHYLLLIGVSDSTVKYDRTVKLRIYAEAEVAEVWLVNPPRQILEVHLEPEKGKYKVVKKYEKNEFVSPKLLPDVKIKVLDIIGRTEKSNTIRVFAPPRFHIRQIFSARQL